jgi:hypothetical protein
MIKKLVTTFDPRRYEDVTHNQETVTRDLLAFCGLEWAGAV